MQLSFEPKNINWDKIAALAAFNSAIIFSWSVYHHFQPPLLHQFHFEKLSVFLMAMEVLSVLVLPIMAGLLTDHFRKEDCNVLLVFAMGGIVTALVSLGIAFTVTEQSMGVWSHWLVFLFALMLVFINVSYTASNSVIETFCKKEELPIIMSILVIFNMAIQFATPFLLSWLDHVGGGYVFLFAAGLLMITGIWFAKSAQSVTINNSNNSKKNVEGKNNFYEVVFFGLLAGLCNTLVIYFFPTVMSVKFPWFQSVFGMRFGISLLLIITAFVVPLVSFFVKREWLNQLLVIASLASFIILTFILISENTLLNLLATLILAIAYSLVLITAFPIALMNVSTDNKALGTGIFFASFEFFNVVFRIFSLY